MLVKRGFSTHSKVSILGEDQVKTALASPEIVDRLEKHAKRAQSLAPKSDDFLYFSIIFLKAAESALIDEIGELKKVGTEKAWGYFDDNWVWHGNVKPHRNNNRDIFPEAELKKAARNWIGKPLCVDHKSDSVDGVRGIILDTHYDEKRKQVVGLCALDKVNYPDLARKVATGVVRFGSMGTGVEQSICTECANVALAPSEYCTHINKRAAWGEINVGLKPIEYSLVVQPAEPGAILLRCIASLEEKSGELTSYGIDDVDGVLKTLNATQANALDLILDKVCTGDACSLDQRKQIITSFVKSEGFTKEAGAEKTVQEYGDLADTLAKLDASGLPPETVRELQDEAMAAFRAGQGIREVSAPADGLTSGESVDVPAQGITGPDGNTLESATRADTSEVAGVTEPAVDTFEDTGVGIHDDTMTEVGRYAADDNILEKFTIKSIKEDIMKEAIKRRRAEARRKIAYHQGGSEGVEPNDYKSEKYPWDKDKHMHPNPAQTGSDEMMGDDKSVKEQQKRAKKAAKQKKEAFHFGGAHPSVEPSTYTSEDYNKYWMDDKHMHQTKSMGGEKGMFPGDEQIKSHQKRASYEGPALKTRVRQVKRLDGSLNKSASVFEVYAGDKLVIATTAKEIWGPQLERKWDYFASREYGRDVAKAIRSEGLHAVAMALTKSAQELPPAAPEMGAPAAGDPAAPAGDPAAPAGDLGGDLGDDLGGDLPPADDLGAEEPAEDDPKAAVEDALSQMEEGISEIRSRLDEVASGPVDVDVNIGESSKDADKLALSSEVIKGLKSVYADAENSADELALLAETYEEVRSLSSTQRRELGKLAKAALMDASRIIGETETLLKMAHTLSNSMIKTSEYYEEVAPQPTQDDMSDLIAEAKELRKNRRSQLLKEAEELLNQVSHADGEHEEHEKEEEKEHSEEEKHDADDHKADNQKNYRQKNKRKILNYNKKHNSKKMNEEDASEEKDGKEEAEEQEDEAHDGIGLPGENRDIQSLMNLGDDAQVSAVKAELARTFKEKKAEEERESYKIKLRRAFDLAMEMQKKGFISSSRAALNEQVDKIMDFDDNAFEAFKSTVASAKPAVQTKVASDLGGLNIGVSDGSSEVKKPGNFYDNLNKLWSDR